MTPTEYAIKYWGYKWMAFTGIPVRGTEGYPRKQRVRMLMSPEQIDARRNNIDAAKEWSDIQPATGNEPLAYAYCSSGGYIASLPSEKDMRLGAHERRIDELKAENTKLQKKINAAAKMVDDFEDGDSPGDVGRFHNRLIGCLKDEGTE